MGEKTEINENGREVKIIKPDAQIKDPESFGAFKNWKTPSELSPILSIKNLDKIPDIDKYVVSLTPAKDNLDMFGKAATILSESYKNATISGYQFAYIGNQVDGNLLHLGMLGHPSFTNNISPSQMEIRSSPFNSAERAANAALGDGFGKVGGAAGTVVDGLDVIDILDKSRNAVQANAAGDIRQSNDSAAKATGGTVKFVSNKQFETVGFAACAIMAEQGAAGGAIGGSAAGGVGALPGAAVGGIGGFVVCGIIVMLTADKAAEGLGAATEFATKELLDSTRQLQVVDVHTKQKTTVVVGNTIQYKAKPISTVVGKPKIIKLIHRPSQGIKVVKPIYHQKKTNPNSVAGNKPVDM